MKKTFAVILCAAVILLAAAFALQGVTRLNAQKDHVKLMETLLPNGKDFVKLDYTEKDGIISSVHKASNGYVIETVTQGYNDEITMLIGVDNNGTVTGLVTLNAHETNGLGSKIFHDHVFLSKFLNKSGTFTIAADTSDANKNEIAVDGITGATVSSKAVAKCVNAAVAYVTGADVQSSATEWGG